MVDACLRGQFAIRGMYMSEKAKIEFSGRLLISADGLLLPPPMQTPCKLISSSYYFSQSYSSPLL
jgi:hypothetical protein